MSYLAPDNDSVTASWAGASVYTPPSNSEVSVQFGDEPSSGGGIGITFGSGKAVFLHQASSLEVASFGGGVLDNSLLVVQRPSPIRAVFGAAQAIRHFGSKQNFLQSSLTFGVFGEATQIGVLNVQAPSVQNLEFGAATSVHTHAADSLQAAVTFGQAAQQTNVQAASLGARVVFGPATARYAYRAQSLPIGITFGGGMLDRSYEGDRFTADSLESLSFGNVSTSWPFRQRPFIARAKFGDAVLLRLPC